MSSAVRGLATPLGERTPSRPPSAWAAAPWPSQAGPSPVKEHLQKRACDVFVLQLSPLLAFVWTDRDLRATSQHRSRCSCALAQERHVRPGSDKPGIAALLTRFIVPFPGMWLRFPVFVNVHMENSELLHVNV